MARPKKGKPSKTTEEVEAMTSDETIEYVFGATGRQVLKEELVTHEERKKNDYRLPPQ